MDDDTHNVHPRLAEQYNIVELQMGMTAEKVASETEVARQAQDEYALRSHQRAADATESGRFDDEIVPVETEDGQLDADEGIRPDTTLEKLSQLPTVFKSDGTVTPGNASQVSDGAAGLMVTSREFAEDRGLDVLASIGTNEVAGVDPTVMGIGPVPAARGLTRPPDRETDDYGLVEINEAFASQCQYSRRELGIDATAQRQRRRNRLGHPLGASGARLPVTLVHEMNRRDADRVWRRVRRLRSGRGDRVQQLAAGCGAFCFPAPDDRCSAADIYHKSVNCDRCGV